MVGEHPKSPRAILFEHHCGGADAEFFRAQQRIGGGRDQEHRADAPDRRACLGREEEALHRVAETEFVESITRRSEAFLVDDRQNGAGNQVPVFIQIEGENRLDVGRPLRAVARTAPMPKS